MEGTGTRQFEFHTCLGRGGFGEVYRATLANSGGLSTEVAIKLLRADIGLGDGALERLRDEGQLLARLRHPAILRVVDLTELDGRVGLITEYIEGEDLHLSIRHPSDPIPLRPLLQAIGEVAEALDAAHETVVHGRPLKLIHRDIKPSNIRIGLHGETKLLDFGVAFSSDEDRHAHTQTNTALGSLAYMAPERFRRTRPDAAADVYALGCCLFEGLVRERLFTRPTAVEMFARAAVPEDHDTYVSGRFASLPSEMPAAVGALLGDMLAYDEHVRPSARVVAERCEALASQSEGPTLRRWMRRHERMPPARLRGSLEGRTLVDSLTHHDQPATEGSSSLHDASIPPSSAPAASLSTLPPTDFEPFDLPTQPQPPSQAPEPSAGPSTGLLAGLAVIVAVLVLVAGALLLDPLEAEPVPAVRQAPPLELGVAFEPEEPAMGTVRILGDVRGVELRSAGEVYGPGEVPAGTYEVYADFGLSMKYVVNLTVWSGQIHTLECGTSTCTKR